jgi:subfamily B ATP-binding cassette protein HlyB/CyaB
VLLGKAREDQVLVQNPLSPQPALMSRAEFEAVWDGRIVLMTGRAALGELSRRFGRRSWFSSDAFPDGTPSDVLEAQP